MDLDQHPDQDAAAAARDPNASGVELADELGSERPGPAWFACMELTGLDAGREIARLRAELDAARKEAERQHAETMRAERWGETQFDARRKAEQALEAEAATARTMRFRREVADKEVDQLRAQRDRAERLLQEQATEIRVLRERVRKFEEQAK